jgi:hypothetical protein
MRQMSKKGQILEMWKMSKLVKIRPLPKLMWTNLQKISKNLKKSQKISKNLKKSQQCATSVPLLYIKKIILFYYILYILQWY